MTHVLVLIAPADAQIDGAASDARLSEARVAQILAPIPEQNRGQLKWLAPGTACEVEIGPGPVIGNAAQAGAGHDLLNHIRSDVIARHRDTLDLALIPSEARRKMLLLSDMDSTMIQQECIDELADFAGLKNEVASITQRAMNGELDFASALTERVALLAGLPTSTLETVVTDRLRLMPGARTLVQTMRKHGAQCVLVSGGFTFFTSAISEQVGFHAHHANTLEIENDRLTGRVVRPILGAQAKLETLNHYLSEKTLMPHDAVAVGDGANDLAMVEAAGLGVAFRAHKVLSGRADAVINHADLTALLHLQGYTRDDFVD
ncbi:MAG: phosphoserine phosphatase SerB [Pseudomonadota bacterium]